MLTAKDVREVQFHKAMGGYKTIEVDEFLDQCADTLEALTAQNEENKNKMQVLAETIVEYRNQEDSIRFALINAQRMAESVVKEAQEKANNLLADAEEKADSILADAQNAAADARELALKETKAEQKELMRIRKEVADFRSRLLSIYREHLTLIGVLEDTVPPAEMNTDTSDDTESTDKDTSDDEPLVEIDVLVDDEPTPIEDAPAYSGKIPDFSAFELKEDE